MMKQWSLYYEGRWQEPADYQVLRSLLDGEPLAGIGQTSAEQAEVAAQAPLSRLTGYAASQPTSERGCCAESRRHLMPAVKSSLVGTTSSSLLCPQEIFPSGRNLAEFLSYQVKGSCDTTISTHSRRAVARTGAEAIGSAVVSSTV